MSRRTHGHASAHAHAYANRTPNQNTYTDQNVYAYPNAYLNTDDTGAGAGAADANVWDVETVLKQLSNREKIALLTGNVSFRHLGQAHAPDI